jgi:hypothetical protein
MRTAIILCGLVLAAGVHPASAQWHFAPTVGLTTKGHTNAPTIGFQSTTSINVGGAVSLLGAGILGVEGVGVFTPRFNADDALKVVEHSRALALMGNGVLTLPRRLTEYSLRPYVSGGVGLMRLSVLNTQSVLPFTSNQGGFNIGAGAIGFLSKRTGLRFDARYYSTFNRDPNPVILAPPGRYSYLTLSVGVVFRR